MNIVDAFFWPKDRWAAVRGLVRMTDPDAVLPVDLNMETWDEVVELAGLNLGLNDVGDFNSGNGPPVPMTIRDLRHSPMAQIMTVSALISHAHRTGALDRTITTLPKEKPE